MVTMSYIDSIRESSVYRWERTKDFVINKPLNSLILSVAMKVLGFYCRTFFNPIGPLLFLSLFVSSLVLDTAAIKQSDEYRERLIASFRRCTTIVRESIDNFLDNYVPEGVRGFIGGRRSG